MKTADVIFGGSFSKHKKGAGWGYRSAPPFALLALKVVIFTAATSLDRPLLLLRLLLLFK